MMQRTTKLLIGKDISRDAQVVAGASMATLVASTGLADGEVVVLDKNKNVLAEGATIADSDIIYIAQGTADTYDYTNEAGTTTSTNRKVIFSDPIEGIKVKSYKGESYVAPEQQVTKWTVSAFVAGTEYTFRLVYKDMPEHPGQFTHNYRHIATTTTLDTEITLIAAMIQKHTGRRVTVTEDNTDLIFTGRAVPEGTTGLTDIDGFKMVNFELFVNSISPTTGVHSEFGTVTYTTTPKRGSGYWADVRDIEKSIQGYLGVTNYTHFPVILPSFGTVVSATYDLIVIESDRSYLSPDNQYIKQAPLTTIIAMVVPSAGTQQTNILAQLNPWMNSLPGGFANVSV